MKSTDRYFVEGVACIANGRRLPVANLSVGGLFAATDDPPIPGQVIALGLELGERPAFKVLAKVTWVNRPDAPRAPHLPQGFGVKITKIDFPDKLALLDLLKRARHRPTRS